MLTTVEAVLQPGGTLKFLEPVHRSYQLKTVQYKVKPFVVNPIEP